MKCLLILADSLFNEYSKSLFFYFLPVDRCVRNEGFFESNLSKRLLAQQKRVC